MRRNVLTASAWAPRRFLLTMGASLFLVIEIVTPGRNRLGGSVANQTSRYASWLSVGRSSSAPFLPRNRTKAIRRAAMYHIPNRYYGALRKKKKSHRPNTRSRFVAMAARVASIRARNFSSYRNKKHTQLVNNINHPYIV